jgi:hypothetical protein
MGTKNQKTLKDTMMKAILAGREKGMGILPAYKIFSTKSTLKEQH